MNNKLKLAVAVIGLGLAGVVLAQQDNPKTGVSQAPGAGTGNGGDSTTQPGGTPPGGSPVVHHKRHHHHAHAASGAMPATATTPSGQ